MPFDELFAVRYDSPVFRDSGHSGIFYAQSWAFLHYCRFGVNRIPPEKMALFLRVAGSPEIQERPGDFRAVSQDLLGLDYAGLQKEVQRYITSGKFRGGRVKRPGIAPSQGYAARPVATEEMNVRLAELALRMAGSAYANLFIRARLEQAPEARLYELLGAVSFQAGETEVAREQWRRAVELGTTNAAIFRELGRIETNLVFGQFDLDYRMPEKRAAELRHLLHASLECAPEQSMGYEMLAWVEAMAAKPDIASLTRIQERFNTLNDRARTLLALVVVRMRLGQTADALDMLNQMDKLKPNDWVLYCAELTRARLEARPVDRSRLPRLTTPGVKMALPAIQLPH